MASAVTPPRGMRDILPADKVRRERVLAVIRSVYRAHGFDEIETPVVEDASRLFSGLGGDNEKLAYAVMKRGLTADDLAGATAPLDLADLGLRFDLTVPLARFYASNRGQLPGVFRSIQVAPVWRAERPQKGRYRQFVQCDIDIIGESGIVAEVELITATVAALDALGVPGCSIRINDRRLLNGLLAHFEVPETLQGRALVIIDKLDKIGLDGVQAELLDAGIASAPAILERMGGSAGEADAWHTLSNLRFANSDAVDALLEIRAAVGAAVPLVFDPTLVRGMGYYTGPIFEIAHPELGYSLGGGGRYDGMIGRFLGTEVPATGFSLGFERLIDLVELEAADDASASALLYEASADVGAVIALKGQLIAEGARVRLLTRPKNMKAALDQLAADGFARFAVVGVEARADTADAATLDWRRLDSAH